MSWWITFSCTPLTEIRPVQKSQQAPVPEAPGLPGSVKQKPFALLSRNTPSRDSVWTLLSHPIKSDQQHEFASRESSKATSRHQRSLSQSTVDTQLAQERLESGAFKIVIDRPDSAPKPDQNEDGLPTLEVPIPHYRLGTPRFSARGTAFFHQSIYTKSSATGEDSSIFSGGEYGDIFPRPPGIEAHHIISRRHSYASAQPWMNSQASRESGAAAPNANIYKTKAPITPEVFDIITASPNDPSIVKYSPINRDIIAATPARIITQITSEKFLDYELLSDFFLTVRSYLSTHDLLAYLLSRFEWALSRSDDSGQVVRVRTFAALRHWILNYFSYDFVTDRDLRVEFCSRLNHLARTVTQTPGYAVTDMKLISDLKKCWNGRCLVYWDNSTASMDGLQQTEIEPGGILGSRDSRLVHSSQLRPSTAAPPSLTVNPAQIAAGAQSISNWYTAVMEHSERQAKGHARHTSTGTTQSYPVTAASEQSVPAISCSIPARHATRATPYLHTNLGAQPVTGDGQDQRFYPVSPTTGTQDMSQIDPHRRSGSFTNAAGDHRAPLSTDIGTSSEAITQEIYHGNSMLRGFAFPPIPADVSPVATTPAFELPQLPRPINSTSTSEVSSNRKPSASNSAHGKGLMSNIRRVLSSKHAQQPGQNAPVSPIAIGKSVTLPQNVLSQASNRAGQFGKFRLDYLAANVFEAFQIATTTPAPSQQEMYVNNIPDPNYFQVTSNYEPAERMSDGSERLLTPRIKHPKLSRLTSGVTDSSRSILIGDDTGLNMQDMEPHDQSVRSLNQETNPDNSRPANIDQAVEVQSPPFHRGSPPVTKSPLHKERLTGSFEDEEQHEWNPPIKHTRPLHQRNPSHATVRTGSLSLRRHASFHSTYAKHNKGLSIDTTPGSRQDSMMFIGAPARMLRRRPGGDLRANDNVHDMEHPIRPRSAGSIVTYAESVRESQLLGFGEKITRTFVRNTRDLNQALVPPISAAEELKKDVSYVRTHSSQRAIRRPSFEAAVAEFARIPDDEEGGLEVTLLKLEGKYKSPVQSPMTKEFPSNQLQSQSSLNNADDVVVRTSAVTSESSGPNTIQQDLLPPSSLPHVPIDHKLWQSTPLSPVQLKMHEPRETVISTVYAESEDSYNSTPLLERSDEENHNSVDKGKGRQVSGPDSIARRLRKGSLAPTATTDSFLLDEGDEFLSDVSSELSMDTIDAEAKSEEWVRSIQSPDENMVMGNHQHPPSPPMTAEIAYSMGLQPNKIPQQRKPPTPDPSPIARYMEPDPSVSADMLPPPSSALAPHMPFVLGFDSHILARQFTILEKEALREIDWRDLVDLRWQNSLASPQNWVSYLLSQDPLGIDLVTARFNIMVKWTISEIVLTESIEERALTIMKYIHIAHQARKIHNFATLFQLTIALTSADCNRLSKTWDLVPVAEKDILQDLEILVSPRRNFHNLRAEMEKVNSDEGCIPVLALYIHDLTYNAGKPSQLPASNDGEPLINFERYRTAATIVKALLQLIDAAGRYDFQPIPGAIERCLWLACLSDDVIMQRSKQLASKV